MNASQLPASNLDSRGDRLRFDLAWVINECEAQYRNGANDKTTNTVALLNAALAKLTPMSTIGSMTINAISTDNVITAAEAASPITVTVTTAGVTTGAGLTVWVDGAPMSGVTVSTVGSNSANITISSAAATALTIGTHTLKVFGTDTAGVYREASRTFSRTA